MAFQAKYVSEGRSVDYTPSGDVAAGAVVVQGTLVGVAKIPIPDATLGALAVEGIFDVHQAAVTFTVGQAVYWDADATAVATATTSGAAVEDGTLGPFMGFALAATEITDETVRVVLRSIESAIAETFGLADLSDVAVVAYTAGKLLIANGSNAFDDQALSGPFNLSAAGLLSMDAATVAAAGSSQADAGALADGFSLVSAADGAKGAKLPTAAAGGLCVVKNNAAAVLKLYPNTSDKINGGSANAAINLAAYTTVVLVAYDATDWYTNLAGLTDLSDVGVDAAVTYTAGKLLVADGDSYESVAVSGPLNLAASGLVSVDSATVAAAGSAQGDAAAIADGFTLVSGADAAKGVKLPAAAAGGLCLIKNGAAANLLVYPNTDDAINAEGANNALTMAANTSAVFVAYDGTTWYTIPLLPS